MRFFKALSQYSGFVAKMMNNSLRIAHFTTVLMLSIKFCSSAFSVNTPYRFYSAVLPTLVSITPSNSHVGDTVKIKGSGFNAINSSANRVFFVNSWLVQPPNGFEYDSIQAEILSVTDTTILAVVPIGAIYGDISVSVNEEYATFTNRLIYNIIPTIGSFIPDTGYLGDTITITGTGFDTGHPMFNHVWFTNGNNTSAISVTPTSIQVIVPSGATNGPVTVFTNTPRVTSTFNFHILPSITFLSRESGIVGEQITIFGSGFDPDQAALYQLTFNGTPAVITSIHSTGMETRVPVRASSGPVRLLYNNSEVKGSGKYFWVVPTTPIISEITPESGTIGTPVVIHGSGFDQAGPPLTVTFGGDAIAEIDSYTGTTIYTKVPPGAYRGTIKITSGGRSSENGPFFRVVETILDMKPSNAHVGDTIVVTGSGFATFPSDYYTIKFPNTTINPIAVTNTTLTFVVPSSASSSFVPVIPSLGHNINLPRMNIIPVITRIEPDTVIAGRQTEIFIRGSGIRSSFQDIFEVVFPNNVQRRISDKTDTSFVTTVPQLVTNGTVPVFVRLNDLSSLAINLTILPDTFPYTPKHPEFLYPSSITTTSFTCTWTKCYRALGYILDVSPDNFRTFLPGFKSLVLTDTSKMISGLEPGTNYVFRLRPYSNTDTAAYSFTVLVKTIPLAPVAAPAIAVDGGFICSWSPVKGAESYWIDVSDNSFDTFISGETTETSIGVAIIGMAPQSLKYRVRALTNWGSSDYSNIVSIILTDAGRESVKKAVMLYPNPSNEYVHISGLQVAPSETLVIDASGKIIPVTLSEADNIFSLNIRALPDGMFILQMVINQKTIQLKFIKK
ncbi:MAG TPA: IPT/TIG domain-containing protein [Ohtaekwangia sp.]